MKILLDTCVSGVAKQPLLDLGHDVVWSGDWPKDPGDEALLAIAFTEQRVIVTLDNDFGELATLKGHKHCGIVRLVQVRALDQGPICGKVMEKYGEELLSGAIVTVEPARVRIRSANKPSE